jgi:phytoene dehydrogenase-like protein
MTPLDGDAALGKIGLPAPLSELAARDWDAVVVGAGHNGLTAAAYLARAGRSVLVLERQERIGGACTLEQPFPDPRYLISPCAYVVGLLDGLVIRELELERHGYRALMADPNLWCPLPDGSSVGLFLDRGHTAVYLREHGFSERDIGGLNAYEELFQRLRRMLRTGPRDTWVGSSPTREELEELLGHDEESISVVFEESIAETLDRYIDDERIKHALFGQGVIGAFAGPRDPGTASVKLMHHQGDLLGRGPVWGYVEGGMGRVSFAIAEAAKESGAMLAAGVPVARILPGEGVEVESGELIRARVVISNADPKRTLAMLGDDAAPAAYRERIEAWRTESPVVKLNAGLHALPAFAAAGGEEAHRAMVSITPGLDAAQEAADACRRGELRGALLSERLRPLGGAAGAPHDERLRTVRPIRVRGRRLGVAADGGGGAHPRRHRRLRPGCPRLRRVPRGAGAARHRAARRPHRGSHLPGRGASGANVGSPLRPPDAGRGAVPVRGGHPSGRLGDRPQRPQRRDGRDRGRRRG